MSHDFASDGLNRIADGMCASAGKPSFERPFIQDHNWLNSRAVQTVSAAGRGSRDCTAAF
jgi:hypothetical protein